MSRSNTAVTAQSSSSCSFHLRGKGKSRALSRPSISKRAPPSSVKSSSVSSEDEEQTDRAEMLAALQAHGRSMFGFTSQEPEGLSSEGGRKRLRVAADDFGSGSPDGHGSSEGDGEEDEEDGHENGYEDGYGDEDEDDDGWQDDVVPQSGRAKVPEVVCAPSDTGKRGAELSSKSERKAFLLGTSSKMMGMKVQDEFGAALKRGREEEDGEDQSNLKLDRTLHDMLLTTLLPTNAQSNASRPSEKRNAIHGRLLELASYSLPGQGSSQLTSADHSKHPAKIRTGLVHAQAKREGKARAEAEAAGSWVKGVGGLGDLGKGSKHVKGINGRKGGKSGIGQGGQGQGGQISGRGLDGRPEKRLRLGEEEGRKKGMQGRTNERSRGLAIGIGRFEGGALRLSKREVEKGSREREPRDKREGGKRRKRG